MPSAQMFTLDFCTAKGLVERTPKLCRKRRDIKGLAKIAQIKFCKIIVHNGVFFIALEGGEVWLKLAFRQAHDGAIQQPGNRDLTAQAAAIGRLVDTLKHILFYLPRRPYRLLPCDTALASSAAQQGAR
ncbi:MAG: hypothetical protein KJO62_12955 [Gammaproteobacteria bacterium]|nr:hypothetical protein [Gammaproteobacteria bacterium]